MLSEEEMLDMPREALARRLLREQVESALEACELGPHKTVQAEFS